MKRFGKLVVSCLVLATGCNDESPSGGGGASTTSSTTATTTGTTITTGTTTTATTSTGTTSTGTTTTGTGGQGGGTTSGSGGDGGTTTGTGGEGGTGGTTTGSTTSSTTTTTTTSTTTTSTTTTTPPLACTPVTFPTDYKLDNMLSPLFPAGPDAGGDAKWTGLAFDAVRGDVLMFGGRAPSQSNPVGTWAWNGTVWTQLASPPNGPTARIAFTLVYDKQRNKSVLFGGSTVNSQGNRVALGDTWIWNGSTWTQPAINGPTPPARSSHAASYDSDTGAILVHGGVDASNEVLGDLWRWDGSGWTNVVPPGAAPSARAHHGMAYDPIRKRTVLYGGTTTANGAGSGAVPTGGVWEWDGASWQNPVGTGQQPSSGANTVLVFDPSRNKIVSFGGTVYENGFASDEYNEFHIWDGAAWSKLKYTSATVFHYSFAASSGGSVLAHHASIAYDECRNRIVVYRPILGYSPDLYEIVTTGHPNNPPLWLSPPGPQQIYPGDLAQVSLTAVDLDGDTLTYSGSPMPPGATIGGPTGSKYFAWKPTAADAGEYTITFTASDGLGSASTDVPIHVGDLTYPDLPMSTSVNVTLTGTGGLAYCHENSSTGVCTPQQSVGNVTATCLLTGTNPGRVTASCNLHVPQYSYIGINGNPVSNSAFDVAAGGPVKGDMTFRGSFSTNPLSFSYDGRIVPGPAVKLQAIDITRGSDELSGGNFTLN